MSEVVILVGPPGSGKSTLAKSEFANHIYVNQDSQGKEEHFGLFLDAIATQRPVVVDRMGFNKEQREKYLGRARKLGYVTRIVVLHESFETCYNRIKERTNHETIKDIETGRKVLHFFFTRYERPTQDEADFVEFRYPAGSKPTAVICDLDGTLCNVEHRRHFVRREGKKDWKSFFAGIENDTVNLWCAQILQGLMDLHKIVYVSGRGDEYEKQTRAWLAKHKLDEFHSQVYEYDQVAPLFMRARGDSRHDYIVKEIILDFEVLTRYKPVLFIDDRKQVVDLWRRRGYVCLHCDDGEF